MLLQHVSCHNFILKASLSPSPCVCVCETECGVMGGIASVNFLNSSQYWLYPVLNATCPVEFISV